MRAGGAAHPSGPGSIREAGRLLYVLAPYMCTASILLASWQYASIQINPIFFPSPMKVLSAVWRLNAEGNFFVHVGVSLWRILVGFLLGSAAAIPIGVLMGMKLNVKWSLDPYVHFFRFIPAIAMVIFAISWFGSGEKSKIFIILFGTLFAGVALVHFTLLFPRVMTNENFVASDGQELSEAGQRWAEERLGVKPGSTVARVAAGMISLDKRLDRWVGLSKLDRDLNPALRALHARIVLIPRRMWGLAALFVYESQVPDVARTKREGLKNFYGLDDDRAVAFFTVHEQADLIHRQVEQDVLADKVNDGNKAAVLKAADDAARALWSFLDGVYEATIGELPAAA